MGFCKDKTTKPKAIMNIHSTNSVHLWAERDLSFLAGCIETLDVCRVD
jgi:hypothetical protein